MPVNEAADTFEEVQDILPKNAFVILTAALLATVVFMLMCTFIESIGTPMWMFVSTSVIFAGVILFCFFVKLRVSIVNTTVHVRFLKKYDIPFDEIIDHKVGDISIIRNYSGWGIKKVTFKNLISVGYDRGVSLKLTGRKVVTISLSDPDRFVSMLPSPQS
ncbi:MAG: hypothetical protein FWG41_04120 [Methanomassiliicoccaceae archaeon]|nr:hypothetical protein [Methanomassiliicoccaceae archaeon]